MFFERGDDRNFYSFDNLLKMTTILITIPIDKVTIRPPLLKTAIVFSGKTPFFTAEQFREMGYRMVIFPASAMRVAIKAIYELFSEIRNTGTQKHMIDRMYTRKQLYELLDYNGMLELEAKFAGKVLDK